MPNRTEHLFSTKVMSYMRQADTPGTNDMARFAVQQYGLPNESATHLAKLVADIVAATQRESLSITEVKKNPGKMLANLFSDGPQRVADAKKKELPEAMVLETRDVAFLINTMVETMTPRYATGKDVFARLAREGRPSALALEPPQEEIYDAPDMGEILSEGRKTDRRSSAEKAA